MIKLLFIRQQGEVALLSGGFYPDEYPESLILNRFEAKNRTR
jgi:hypothetical protein